MIQINYIHHDNTINSSRRFTGKRLILTLAMWVISLFFPLPLAIAAEKKPMNLQDIMKFKEIHTPVISEQGDWVIYSTKPDRGNSEAIATHLKSAQNYSIPRGSAPIITKDGNWIAAVVLPDFAELEKTGNNKNSKEPKPKNGMALLDTTSGKITTIDLVNTFAFSENSQWLYYCRYPVEKKDEEIKKEVKKKEEEGEKNPEPYTVVLRHLADGQEVTLDGVVSVLFDPASRFLAYSRFEEGNGDSNGIFVRNLNSDTVTIKKIHGVPLDRYSALSWSKTKSRMAFIVHQKKEQRLMATLIIWDGLKDKLLSPMTKQPLPIGWMVPEDNELSWTQDEDRLFFGLKPVSEYNWSHPDIEKTKSDSQTEETPDIYNLPNLLKKTTVDVWHWQDPLINAQQKMEWEKFAKQIYTAVYLFKEARYLQLADEIVPKVNRVENPDYSLGFADQSYKREITWDGYYNDVYYINLRNGSRKKILNHFSQDISLSVKGLFIVYYLDKHWYLLDTRTGVMRNLTSGIVTPFYKEDYDLPDAVPGYGIAGWTENDRSVLIYDKYDIWEFLTTPSLSQPPLCLTNNEGRKQKLVFRVNQTDPEAKYIKTGQALLLSAYSDTKKYTAFYRGYQGKKGVEQLLFMPDRTFTFVKKAKKSDTLLFTRENFEEFPDLWVADKGFTAPRQISHTNLQQQEFLWGKAELMEWLSFDGKPLQGIVIKPENYDPEKRYPVLVYYYETFTEDLYRFNQVVINHRPCFPYYSGNGYVLFLPDIRFEVGRPGFSSAKCLVSGVQKLIDLGIADAKRIGLHGHSWSGYQTAFIVTQTDIFAAAIAGAPVSNMTSAYNGIRWGVGMARQFQYEKAQSRIGPGLLDAPLLYLENSPIFQAKYIHTPLLIQFGDLDEAVPWYQGIELYLTMRRLDKNCIFLQYNDEPHHLKKYPNKLDYTIKMKEYLDHYLKGAPAPAWITEGIPFRKK